MAYDMFPWVWRQRLRSRHKLVLLAMADFADSLGIAYPSASQLTAMTGLDKKSVKTGLIDLEAMGLIVRTGRKAGYRNSCVEYRIPYDYYPPTSPKNGLGKAEPSPKTDPVIADQPGPNTGTVNPPSPKTAPKAVDTLTNQGPKRAMSDVPPGPKTALVSELLDKQPGPFLAINIAQNSPLTWPENGPQIYQNNQPIKSYGSSKTSETAEPEVMVHVENDSQVIPTPENPKFGPSEKKPGRLLQKRLALRQTRHPDRSP